MPEISRFFGIIIRIYFELQTQHNRPHFHAYYQGKDIAVAIDNEIEVIAGSFPKRQERLVLAWAELHRKELLDNWTLAQIGERTYPIEPLRK